MVHDLALNHHEQPSKPFTDPVESSPRGSDVTLTTEPPFPGPETILGRDPSRPRRGCRLSQNPERARDRNLLCPYLQRSAQRICQTRRCYRRGRRGRGRLLLTPLVRLALLSQPPERSPSADGSTAARRGGAQVLREKHGGPEIELLSAVRRPARGWVVQPGVPWRAGCGLGERVKDRVGWLGALRGVPAEEEVVAVALVGGEADVAELVRTDTFEEG